MNRSFAKMQHVFLVGNLQQPCPHPFFRDARLEVIACEYEAGDHGLFHWHSVVTEYEYVIDGTVTYVEALSGIPRHFHRGDLATVPAGTCVRRMIDGSCHTLAVKVPSNDEKIHCRACDRICPSRVEARA